MAGLGLLVQCVGKRGQGVIRPRPAYIQSAFGLWRWGLIFELSLFVVSKAIAVNQTVDRCYVNILLPMTVG